MRGNQLDYPSTRFRLGRAIAVVVGLAAVAVGSWYVATRTDWLTRAAGTVQTVSQGQRPPWMHAKTLPENGATPATIDPYAEHWDKLKRWMEETNKRLEALEKRKEPVAVQTKEKPKPTKKYVTRVSYERKEPLTDSVGEMTKLFAGSYIPGILIPRQNSDRQGCSTVRAREHVKDSATGQHILIPQGSMITMCYKSKDLIWGDERVEVGLDTLTLPDGREVSLPKAAGIDQIGQEGWSGEVDHHYWRLLSAVLIRGVLRGGAQVAQQQLSDNVSTVVLQEGSNTVQQQTAPFINIKPTIITPEGEPVNIRIHKGVSLPIYQEPTHALR